MKTRTLYSEPQFVPLRPDVLFTDETEGDFDDNWIVSANDLFGTFELPEDFDFSTYIDQAA